MKNNIPEDFQITGKYTGKLFSQNGINSLMNGRDWERVENAIIGSSSRLRIYTLLVVCL